VKVFVLILFLFRTYTHVIRMSIVIEWISSTIKGSYGAVHKARHKTTGQIVAAKIFNFSSSPKEKLDGTFFCSR